MQELEYTVSCPKCGKILFRGVDAGKIAMQCPKCRQELRIKYFKGELSLRLAEEKKVREANDGE